jgi:Transposase DDE domain
VDILDFLQGLSQGSLLLFDLGYFSFAFFDTLTQRKQWWVSRYRENTSYSIVHVFYQQREVLDALVWLGTGQKQARHLTRLVRLGDGVGVRMYLTNVCDPQLLSLGDVAQLYARRWDIEMAFRLLKEYLGMSHWWSSKQELILVQIWVVLILSQIVYALRERIATAANCEPFEVSMPRHGGTAAPTLQQLWALIRAACPRGSSTWPGACKSTSRPSRTPSGAFVLSASST